MNPQSIVIQERRERPEQLILLFHGMGETAAHLVPFGTRLAAQFPAATVVSVAAPRASTSGAGFEWFSVSDISDHNRPERVAAAMPGFVAEVRGWQRRADVTAAVTALIGFSQGAIMSLEATPGSSELAARVVAIAGRYATLPDAVPGGTTFHLLHGKDDRVIHYKHAIDAAHRLLELGGDVTADVLPFVGHELHPELAALAIERLTSHVPSRLWAEAMKAAGSLPPVH